MSGGSERTVAGLGREALGVVFDDAPVGFAVLDRELRYVQVNRALAEINGVPAAEHLDRRVREVVPELADTLEEAFRRVLDTGEPASGLTVSGVLRDGSDLVRHWMQSIIPIPAPGGGRSGIAVLVWEITDRVRAERELGVLLTAERQARAEAIEAGVRAEAAASRMRLLQSLAAALVSTLDTRQVARVVVSAVTGALGAQAAAVVERAGATSLRVLAATGRPEPVIVADHEYPLGHWPLAADAIRSRRPVLVASSDDRDRRYPELAGRGIEQAAWAGLPLFAGAEPVGVAAFGWTRPRAFDADDVELLNAIAGQASAALDRARLFEAERAARAAAELSRRRLGLLAEASARLVSSVTEPQLLASLADLLVAEFADRCAVLLPDAENRLHRAVVRAAAAPPGELNSFLVDLPLGAFPSDDPAQIAWRTGRPARSGGRWPPTPQAAPPEREPAASRTPPSGPPDPAFAVPRIPPLRSALAVPLLSRGQTLGVLAVFRRADRPAFDIDDDQFLADLGRRAGAAIDNLRLLAARTRVAARLQETLLPEQLPVIDGVELSAGYVAAEDAADVGGDLYDAFPLGDGSYALVIGDVAGRGVDAAGLTGLARTTLRALGPELPPPAVLGRLNTLLIKQSGDERFLTAAYIRFMPDTGGPGDGPAEARGGATLTVCTAGHPPPLLVRPDGTVTPLGVSGPLLGVLPEVDLVDRSYRVSDGDLVLLYTDGVLEAHGRDGLFGEERLVALLRTLAGHPAADVVTRVEQTIVDYRTGGADDLALLAIRLTPSAEPGDQVLLDQRFAADPAAVRAARCAARRAVAGLLPVDSLDSLLLGVSELVTNALRQLIADPARSPRPDHIHLRIMRRGETLRVEVANPGPRFVIPDRPSDPAAVSGRGLHVVRVLATDLGVSTSSGTTCVWFQMPCRPPR